MVVVVSGRPLFTTIFDTTGWIVLREIHMDTDWA